MSEIETKVKELADMCTEAGLAYLIVTEEIGKKEPKAAFGFGYKSKVVKTLVDALEKILLA